MPSARILPLIVATALLMENIDSSVLSTSLPQIAKDLNSDPIHLKLVLTTYLLALAVFIPASGWMADRFGARKIFRAAIVVFALGSIACALSTNLIELVAARALQGLGGSMMTPVGRLIVLRGTPRAGLVGALAWLTVPALLGPVLGPPLGGYITTYWDWRWIFWINIPIAVLGVILATLYIPDLREPEPRSFDTVGFLLLGPGLAGFLTGATLMGLSLATPLAVITLMAAGAALIALYVRHALRTAHCRTYCRPPSAGPSHLPHFRHRRHPFPRRSWSPAIPTAPDAATWLRAEPIPIGHDHLFIGHRRAGIEICSAADPTPLWLPSGVAGQRADFFGIHTRPRQLHPANPMAVDAGGAVCRRPVAIAAIHLLECHRIRGGAI